VKEIRIDLFIIVAPKKIAKGGKTELLFLEISVISKDI
jgi:hypothetical protein